MKSFLIPAFVASLLLVSGCGSESGGGKGADWGACPEYIQDRQGLDCTTVGMPLDHGNPERRKIDVLALRAEGEHPDKKGQLWFLMGGPGESIAVYSHFLKVWSRTHPRWTYYAVEQRGIKDSTALRCPSAEDGSAECMDVLVNNWGQDGLGRFNPTQTAHDVAAFMDRVGRTGKRFLYGVSYGSYLAQRFALLHPARIDGMILDGAVPAGPMDNGLLPIDLEDQNFNDLVLKIMRRCDQTPACQSRLQEYGENAVDVLKGTYAKLDDGALCPSMAAIFDRTALHQKLAQLVADYYGRMLVPALLYRINRCNRADVDAVTALFEPKKDDDKLFNENLNANIIVSELIGGSSLKEAKRFSDRAYASPDETLQQYRRRAVADWPVYSPGTGTHEWPETNMPVLIMNGSLDPQTPMAYARYVKSFYTGENQYLVKFPTARHGTLLYTLMPNVDPAAGDTCGTRVFFDFVNDVTTVPDSGCNERMLKPDFSGSTQQARTAGENFFGTQAIWGSAQ